MKAGLHRIRSQKERSNITIPSPEGNNIGNIVDIISNNSLEAMIEPRIERLLFFQSGPSKQEPISLKVILAIDGSSGNDRAVSEPQWPDQPPLTTQEDRPTPRGTSPVREGVALSWSGV